jgi:quercetin dioxygenase-like cupin family protein
MSNNRDKNKSAGLEPSVPHRLENLLDYTDDSIVSRIIIKKKSGNVTLFSFDENQELSEHTTPYDALVQVIDGRVRLTIGGKDINVKSGETVLMPANVAHAVFAVERFKMLLTMIRE